jgi:carboxyl-terminal processing protease
MTQLYRFAIRPYHLFLLLALSFAAGIVVERAGRFIQPYHYVPSGVEKTFAPFWETWDLVGKRFVDPKAVDPEHMTRGAIDGMLASLGDPGHTRHIPAPKVNRFEEMLQGRLEGIGAGLGIRNGKLTIENTMPGSPARSAGLQPGDMLLEVEGEAVAGLPIEKVIDLVRGPPGSEVRLRISREGHNEPIDITLTRANLEVPDVTWNMVPGLPVADVAIRNFGFHTEEQFKTALEQIRKKGAKALILDIRHNPGGVKDQAVALASEFLKEGDVLIEQDAHGNRRSIPVIAGGTVTDLPVVLLVDDGTASAAEIFAGAIQDHGRGKLIGKKTAGQGTVLEAFRLSDGSALLLAVAEWLTPKGREIWHKGISPDVEVSLAPTSQVIRPETIDKLDTAGLRRSNDAQFLKAIEVIKPQIK